MPGYGLLGTGTVLALVNIAIAIAWFHMSTTHAPCGIGALAVELDLCNTGAVIPRMGG